jgi:hypothetical protein
MLKQTYNNLLFGAGLAAFVGFWSLALTDSLPIPLSKPNAEKHETTKHRAEQESIQDISAEAVAYYTKVLAWFTGVLAAVSIIQGIFLIKADKTARISADAAKLAAESAEKQMLITGRQVDIVEKQHGVGRLQFFAMHRPKLIVRKIRLNPWRHGDGMSVSYTIANVGRSDAIITEHRTIIGIEEERQDGKVARIDPQATVKNTVEGTAKVIITPGEHQKVTAGPTHWKYDNAWDIEYGPKRPISWGIFFMRMLSEINGVPNSGDRIVAPSATLPQAPIPTRNI